MAAQRSTNRSPGNSWLPLILTLFFVFLVLSLWGAVSLARSLDDQPLIANPMELIFSLASGRVPWPGGWAVFFLAAELLLLVGIVLVVVLVVRRRRRGRTRVDGSARLLASDRDLREYTPAGVKESAQRLRPGGAGETPAGHGPYFGKIKLTQTPFMSSWENMVVLIAGPRVGKSTSIAIPLIVDAPGPVIATSNKRDLTDATRLPRSQHGKIWVFDPQAIIGDEPEFWFDPLDGLTEAKADKLVEHFVASIGAEAAADPYFEPEGQALLSYLLLAAAKSGRDITAAYRWAVNYRDREPVTLLDGVNELISYRLLALYELPDRTRAGVFGTAMKLLRCLENPVILRWVVPPSRKSVPKFDPHAFVRSRDTLYLLSREGGKTAGPLVAALTQAVLDAGEEAAQRMSGARLDPPLLGVLDEVANVCRIKELPNLYSHYGSRGMVCCAILQSWKQGVEVWGEKGMSKLFSSANVRIYLGGEADDETLRKFSSLIGEHAERTYSQSRDRTGHTSTTASTQMRPIFTVADLAAFPRGRGVVFASGAPATLIETVPWMARENAAAIRESIARYDPSHHDTAAPVVAKPLEGTP
ncbi:Type IV secretory pathway, VirD4 component, TraG/TraD family ATPase [Lentzea albidocapillata subsp. violacea]|uniref:Type IV secretory pathway, VirD4 component, TraG/TraD family ATPase n=1 Tax=Lentzea albidocapillata subsp. violacea TaxID=128104 RepID=A0A1G9YXD5_9PSEU|nr:TraM recognition domain-containing protein [Lentzea albidocapillata]SDN13567.1 Type IV secretory pathway, VirD4 component, TraG/TraD family ATPase [Lentzea albidocapillata subsp. violacea]